MQIHLKPLCALLADRPIHHSAVLWAAYKSVKKEKTQSEDFLTTAIAAPISSNRNFVYKEKYIPVHVCWSYFHHALFDERQFIFGV